MSFSLLNFDQKYKFSCNKNNMVSAWRNFKNIFPRPLFIIIFRPEMLKFHPYAILTGDARVEFVIYRVLRAYCPNIYTVTYTVDNICGVTSWFENGVHQFCRRSLVVAAWKKSRWKKNCQITRSSTSRNPLSILIEKFPKFTVVIK